MTWYTGDTVYDTVLIAAFAYMALVAIGSQFGQSQYGRFGGRGGGLQLDPRVGWMLMELPAPLVFTYCFFKGQNSAETVPLLFLGLWLMHYANRGFINPLLMRVHKGTKASFGISVVIYGVVCTSLHGYLNGTFVSHFANHLTVEWLSDPRFVLGIAVYACGFILNVHSDAVLRNLRPKQPDPNAPRYRIPHGGGYNFVSSPSYLGEMIAWLGFAIFTWSLGGVFILLVTVANLAPRAFATHRWYKRQFENYPSDRKALIPYLV